MVSCLRNAAFSACIAASCASKSLGVELSAAALVSLPEWDTWATELVIDVQDVNAKMIASTNDARRVDILGEHLDKNAREQDLGRHNSDEAVRTEKLTVSPLS